MKLKATAFLAICVTNCSHGLAGDLVDSSSELKTVRTDFGLADGPAWDGEGTLYVRMSKGAR